MDTVTETEVQSNNPKIHRSHKSQCLINRNTDLLILISSPGFVTVKEAEKSHVATQSKSLKT